jgi:hypothetical protein
VDARFGRTDQRQRRPWHPPPTLEHPGGRRERDPRNGAGCGHFSDASPRPNYEQDTGRRCAAIRRAPPARCCGGAGERAALAGSGQTIGAHRLRLESHSPALASALASSSSPGRQRRAAAEGRKPLSAKRLPVFLAGSKFGLNFALTRAKTSAPANRTVEEGRSACPMAHPGNGLIQRSTWP